MQKSRGFFRSEEVGEGESDEYDGSDFEDVFDSVKGENSGTVRAVAGVFCAK